ncbi:unnamed protein product [Clonostachys rosea]|uniref:Ecp2 effector protein domain-containing protein n=1 Tax=Bionectria ochroleuca TaxID=29856 RepID=A0ABY6TV70_BIOOC|nr:unnamed protein product [Clonostachys rosea]
MVATIPFVLAAGGLLGLAQASPCGSHHSHRPSSQIVTPTSTIIATPTSRPVISASSSLTPEASSTAKSASSLSSVAVSSAVTSPASSPASSPAASSSKASATTSASGAAPTEYKNYKGDGTVAQGWPDIAEWADFETLWTRNIALNEGACNGLSIAPNSETENETLKSSIKSAAAQANLDERFVLATVFQESAGCVRVKTSYSPNEGIRNPGLLQCFNGNFTCNDPEAGVEILEPCPDEQIIGMITDGMGITTSDGFMQCVNEKAGASDVSKYYKGALYYNSGVMPEDGNLGKGRSNACYSSDIANRVMGWSGNRSPCNRSTIGDL